MTYDNIKSHKNAGFHHLFIKNMFEETTEEGGGGKGVLFKIILLSLDDF